MRTISMLVLSSIMFVFHITLSPVIEILNGKIDFIIISIVLIAVFSQKWYPPILCSIYSGLAVDITTQANTYINTGVYLFFGVALGLLILFLKRKGTVITVLTVFSCVALKHLLYVFLLYIMHFSENFTLGTFFYGLPSALYTSIISIGLFFVYKGIFSFDFMQEKDEDAGKYII